MSSQMMRILGEKLVTARRPSVPTTCCSLTGWAFAVGGGTQGGRGDLSYRPSGGVFRSGGTIQRKLFANLRLIRFGFSPITSPCAGSLLVGSLTMAWSQFRAASAVIAANEKPSSCPFSAVSIGSPSSASVSDSWTDIGDPSLSFSKEADEGRQHPRLASHTTLRFGLLGTRRKRSVSSAMDVSSVGSMSPKLHVEGVSDGLVYQHPAVYQKL